MHCKFCTLLVLFYFVNTLCNSLLPVIFQQTIFQIIDFFANIISIFNYIRKEVVHMKVTISLALTFAAISAGRIVVLTKKEFQDKVVEC